MTREEILEKSRKENKAMDEREQAVVLRGASIAKGVGLLLCVLIVFLSDTFGGDPTASLGAFAIYWGMYGTDRAYRWWKLRERSDLLLAIGGFSFFIAMAAAYLSVLLGGA